MAFIPAGLLPNSLVMGMWDAPHRFRHMVSYTSFSPAKLYWLLVSLVPSSTSCTPKLDFITLWACMVFQKRRCVSGEAMENSCGRFFTSMVFTLA